MAEVTYNPNLRVISAQIMRKTGDVDRAIIRRAERVADSAKAIIRAKPIKPNSRRTGRLAQSIHVVRNRTEKGVFGFGYKVIADAPYAAAVHEGSRAHDIPGDGLAFQWKGRQFYTSRRFITGVPPVPFNGRLMKSYRWKGFVHIPRRAGYPFMSRALESVRR